MIEFLDRWWRSGDGLRLYARDYPGASGDFKIPLIAIHGLTRNSADFHSVASAIAVSGRRVIAVDVRGRGRSDWASEPHTYQPPTYARDIITMMQTAGLSRAAFMGTSMGGLITMTMAAISPKMINSVILNDVGPELSQQGLQRLTDYVGKPANTPDWKAAAEYSKRINQKALPHYTDKDWDAFARRTFRCNDDGHPQLDYDPDIVVPIREAGQHALAPNLWPFFIRLARSRPSLLIRGEISDILTAETAASMQKRAPKMRYFEVPGIGHAPMLEEPGTEEAILSFLADQP